MSVTYRITLDLAKETDNAIYGLKVGETGEKIIKVALNENGKALQFDAGESVQLQIKKPDGNIILKDATRVNNLCTFSFSGTNTQQLTAVAGECEAEVVVFGDNFNKSCRFSLFVEEGVISEDEIESTSIYTDLEEARGRYESIVQKAVKKDIIQNIFGYISGNDLIVNYYGYSNDNIDFRTLTADVTSINDSVVYLYQDTANNWAVSFETPSSYNLAPALIGKVKSYWIGNGIVKHFYPLNTVDICHDFYANFSQIYATKQNAEQGKGLSTNDFTNELKATLENIAQTFITNTVNNLTNYYLKSETYSKQEVDTALGNKVDKVEGKGLSTEDYTTAEKTKLAGIEDGAEANVQSDWSQSNSSADDFIKNKPANLVQDSSYVHTDNNFNNDYKSKIETNEYNDIFNIRVEWDRQYMPNAELIAISFQEYENGILVEEICSYNVKDITNGSVYLYKNIGDSWQIAVGTPPSSYHRLPMLVGKIATKTVNGESVKLFFRNGDDETQFDKLNSVKVDKETWELIDTVTIEEAVSEIYKNVDSDGNALKLKAIKILASLDSSSTSTAELSINAYSYNDYTSTVGVCTERLALPDARINYVAEQQNGYWNAEWSGRRAATNYKGGYFLEPAFSTLSVTSKPYIRSWKIKTPTSNVTFSTSTTIEIWGIRGE